MLTEPNTTLAGATPQASLAIFSASMVAFNVERVASRLFGRWELAFMVETRGGCEREGVICRDSDSNIPARTEPVDGGRCIVRVEFCTHIRSVHRPSPSSSFCPPAAISLYAPILHLVRAALKPRPTRGSLFQGSSTIYCSRTPITCTSSSKLSLVVHPPSISPLR